MTWSNQNQKWIIFFYNIILNNNILIFFTSNVWDKFVFFSCGRDELSREGKKLFPLKSSSVQIGLYSIGLSFFSFNYKYRTLISMLNFDFSSVNLNMKLFYFIIKEENCARLGKLSGFKISFLNILDL